MRRRANRRRIGLADAEQLERLAASALAKWPADRPADGSALVAAMSEVAPEPAPVTTIRSAFWPFWRESRHNGRTTDASRPNR